MSALDSAGELVSQVLSHPYDDDDQDAAVRLLDHLATHPATAHRRDCPGGHVTVSTLLVDADTMRTFLVLHPRFGRWMQLGGHVEDWDGTVTAAAMRETIEESGLYIFQPLELLSVGAFDGVACPTGSVTTHFDIRFLATIAADRAILASRTDEHLDAGWFPLDDLPTPHDDDLTLLATQATRALGARAADPRTHH